MVGLLGVDDSPFRPTSRIEGWGLHHHVKAARRWCRCCFLVIANTTPRKSYTPKNSYPFNYIQTTKRT